MSYDKLPEPSTQAFLVKEASGTATQPFVVEPLYAIPVVPAVVYQPQPASSRCCKQQPLGRCREMTGFFFINLCFGFFAFLLSLCATNTHAGRQGAKMGLMTRWVCFGAAFLYMALKRSARLRHHVALPQWAQITIASCFIAFGLIGFIVAVRNWRRLKRNAADAAGVSCGPAMEMQVVA